MGVAENGSYYLEDMVDFVVYVPKNIRILQRHSQLFHYS